MSSTVLEQEWQETQPEESHSQTLQQGKRFSKYIHIGVWDVGVL